MVFLLRSVNWIWQGCDLVFVSFWFLDLFAGGGGRLELRLLGNNGLLARGSYRSALAILAGLIVGLLVGRVALVHVRQLVSRHVLGSFFCPLFPLF